MTFHFRLAEILKWRKLLEERERVTLLVLQSQKWGAVAEAERVDRLKFDSINALHEEKTILPSSADLQFAHKCLDTLHLAASGLRKKADAARKACAMQEGIYRGARRESEILDVLREEQLEQFRLEERRRDQLRLDAIHSLTHKTFPFIDFF